MMCEHVCPKEFDPRCGLLSSSAEPEEIIHYLGIEVFQKHPEIFHAPVTGSGRSLLQSQDRRDPKLLGTYRWVRNQRFVGSFLRRFVRSFVSRATVESIARDRPLSPVGGAVDPRHSLQTSTHGSMRTRRTRRPAGSTSAGDDVMKKASAGRQSPLLSHRVPVPRDGDSLTPPKLLTTLSGDGRIRTVGPSPQDHGAVITPLSVPGTSRPSTPRLPTKDGS